MFAPLLGAVRADIDRQISWAKAEVRRQTRHVALVAALSGVTVLAALGAVIVGLIAVYTWLATQHGPFIALAIIGGGLLLLGLILFTLALVTRRPQLASRPPLQFLQTITVLGSKDRNFTGLDPTLKLATDTLREGPRSAMLATLALAAVIGLMIGRRVRRPNAS